MKCPTILLVLSGGIATVFAQVANYGQCGGKIYTGATTCNDGWGCYFQNEYYSQCLPADPHSKGCKAPKSTPVPAKSVEASPKVATSPVQANPKKAANLVEANPIVENTSKAAPVPPASTPVATKEVATDDTSGTCAPYTGDKTGLASTTHYYDGLKGACGCGTDNAMSPWQANPGPHIYTAAASQFLFAGAGSTSSWCGSGCGTCYELTNIGKVATAGEGSCSTGSSTTITVMVTNLCPANGNQQWCGQETNEYGFAAHFDIMSEQGPEGWDNPVVSYKEVPCPGAVASGFGTCDCAKTSRVRRGLTRS